MRVGRGLRIPSKPTPSRVEVTRRHFGLRTSGKIIRCQKGGCDRRHCHRGLVSLCLYFPLSLSLFFPLSLSFPPLSFSFPLSFSPSLYLSLFLLLPPLPLSLSFSLLLPPSPLSLSLSIEFHFHLCFALPRIPVSSTLRATAATHVGLKP